MSESKLLEAAMASLPRDKPIIFTGLMKFHKQARYSADLPASITEIPSPCTGEEAYFQRYFPIYHAACREVYGDQADSMQRVLYKGTSMMPLQIQSGSEKKWDAIVVTRAESWEVVMKIQGSEMYRLNAGYHRAAAVEDEVLYVSTAAEGFTFER